MSSRGAVILNGHVTTNEYSPVSNILEAVVLKGNEGFHGLPDYSHSPKRKYIKENPDGSFRALREYDENGFPIIEIAYHPEQSLTGNRHEYVLHFHLFKPNLERIMGGKLSETENAVIYYKYKQYLVVYGL